MFKKIKEFLLDEDVLEPDPEIIEALKKECDVRKVKEEAEKFEVKYTPPINPDAIKRATGISDEAKYVNLIDRLDRLERLEEKLDKLLCGKGCRW